MSVTGKGCDDEETAIPLIDVGPLRSPVLKERMAVALQMRAAAIDKGFFYVRNHGVSKALIDEVFAQAATFFALPDEEKSKIAPTAERPNRGYLPLQAITLERGAPPDLKETMTFGPELSPDDAAVLARRFDRTPNLWPQGLPRFRDTMLRYFDSMIGLRDLLLRGLALSLDLAENFFAEYARDGLERVNLLHYPRQPANPLPEEKGCGAHTDFGGLTILAQDMVGGLQVRDEETGEWIDAVPIAGTFVVNLGDQIQRWTLGEYRSNLHRVINASGQERYAIPFFSNGNPDYVIDRLDRPTAKRSDKHFAPTSVENYLKQKIEEARNATNLT